MPEKSFSPPVSSESGNTVIMPELLRHLEMFDGYAEKKQWLKTMERAQILHGLSDAFTIEMAKNKLKGGASGHIRQNCPKNTDFRNISKSMWTKAVIKQKLGRQTYLCIPMDDERLVWKRNVDQVIGIGSFYDNLSEPCKSKPGLVQTEVHDDNDSIDSHGGISEVTASTPEKVSDVVSDGLSALVGHDHTAVEGVLDSVMTDELGRDELTTCRESLRTPVVCSPNIKNRLRKQI
ncbi:hypothetical protein QE152_g14025 [Popillia japonica]|uniref:Uncharacterized protein n=1 Tax=Popillia japonica TaxID=7064 RepID=A0AAW1L9Z4_POPJA